MINRGAFANLLLISVFLGCFAGCQATPESHQLETFSSVIADGHVKQEAFLDDGIKLVIDAQVEISTKRLLEGRFHIKALTTEDVNKIYHALCGGAQPYQWAETAKNLADFVTHSKMILSIADPPPDQMEYAYEMELLDNILKKSVSAPREREVADLNAIFSYQDNMVQVDMGKGYEATFQVLTEPYNQVSFSNFGLPSMLDGVGIDALKITEQEAIAQAESVLNRLGQEGAFSLVRIKKEPVNYTFYDSYLSNEQKKYGYRMLFLRLVDGIPQLDNDRVVLGTIRPHKFDFHQEYIEIIVDDTGVISFIWQTPGEIVVSDKEVSVIPLEDAVRIVHARLKQEYNRFAFQDNMKDNITIRANNVRFGYICHETANNSIAVIPVWEFYGYIGNDDVNPTLFYDVEMQTWVETYRDNSSLCTVNAQNGKVIDRIGKYL